MTAKLKGHVYLKILLRVAGFLLAVILLFFAVVAIYISTHKKEIIEKAGQSISEKIGGEVHIEEASIAFNDFPNISIELINTSIKDSLISLHNHPLLQAGKIYLRVNMTGLLRGRLLFSRFEIDNGSFYLFTDSSGYSNGYLLKRKRGKAWHRIKIQNSINRTVCLHAFLVQDSYYLVFFRNGLVKQNNGG